MKPCGSHSPPITAALALMSCTQTAVADEDVEAESAGANYQLDMMRCLREVNVDNNTVGW